MSVPNIKDADKFVDELIQPLADIFEQLNNDVVGVITRRLAEIGTLKASDVQKLIASARVSDLGEIERLIAQAENKSVKEIDRIVTESAKYNDGMYDVLYKAKQIENLGIAQNKILQSITNYAKDNIVDDVLNLTKTTAFVVDGKVSSIRKIYTESVNIGSIAVRTGLLDYNTAIRQQVLKLANSGLRTVDFESGYSRRLDSQVRMNVLDGVRQMNQDYMKQQGEEFGADGVEISVHFMCAPDHAPIQGRQFTLDEFDRLQNTLKRPIGTMNCHHTTFPVIIGISDPVYSKKEIQQSNAESNRLVTYDLKDGTQKTVTKYEASQVQRNQETNLRRLKEKKLQFDNAGDNIMSAKYSKLIQSNQKYYRQLSEQVGLKPQTKRTAIIK